MRDAIAWSFPIGHLAGITVRVHFLLPLLILGLVWRASGKDYIPGTYADVAVMLGLMFLSVLLHEFGHCFAARRVDGDADEIFLWPLGGLARCDVPHTPWANFFTALGGPLVNFGLCVVSALALGLLMDPSYKPPWAFTLPTRVDDAGGLRLVPWALEAGKEAPITYAWLPILLARLFWVNWLLLLVNICLIGIPFDGGRMFQCVLWRYFVDYKSALQYAIFSGFGIMIILIVVSIRYNEVFLLLLVWYIYSSCKQEWIMLATGGEDSVFGYDFSQGYTSLEREEETQAPAPPKRKKQNFLQRWLQRRAARRVHLEQQQQAEDDRRMDELLEKIQRYGKQSLTDEEQRFLKRVSDRYRNKPS